MEESCRALARHVQAPAEAGNEGKSANERPPHY
nr:hypothetical protein [Sideroxydans sp. CL21]